MKKLPQKSEGQSLGESGENYIRHIFSGSEWNVIKIPQENDFHSDFSIEIFSNGVFTGCGFRVQAKGHKRIKVYKDGSVRESIKASTLNAFLELGDLVVLVCYDAGRKVGYWCWIQDYIRQQLPQGWQAKHKPTIKIPASQIIDEDAIEEIRKRVLRHGAGLRFNQLAETTDDDFYNVITRTDKDGSQLMLTEKYAGALKDDPIHIDFTVDLDKDDPEGKVMRAAMENHLKTGSLLAIPGQFISEFKNANAMRRILGEGADRKPSILIVKPNESENREPVSFDFLDGEGHSLFGFRYLELNVLQKGSEETTYRLRERDEKIEILMKMNSATERCVFDYRLLKDQDRVDALIRFCEFKDAFERGQMVRILNLASGVDVKLPIEATIFDPDNVALLKYLRKLKDIEEEFGIKFNVPKVINSDDVRLTKDVLSAVKVGKVFWDVKPFTLELPVGIGRTIVKNNREDPARTPILFGNDFLIEIFGVSIDLGEKALGVFDHEIVEVTAKSEEEKTVVRGYVTVEFKPRSEKSRAVVFLKRWYKGDADVFGVERLKKKD